MSLTNIAVTEQPLSQFRYLTIKKQDTPDNGYTVYGVITVARKLQQAYKVISYDEDGTSSCSIKYIDIEEVEEYI